MSRRPRPTPDDSPAAADCALFRAAVAGVEPLAARFKERVFAQPSPAPPRLRPPAAAQSAADVAEVQTLAGRLHAAHARLDWCGDELGGWFQSGVDPRLLQRLRRGQWPVEAELDLHGHTEEKAWQALGDFIALSLLRGRRYLRIIHGQGLGSKRQQPVLKPLIHQWLRQRPEVLIHGAPIAEHGRSGAVLVLLRRLDKLRRLNERV